MAKTSIDLFRLKSIPQELVLVFIGEGRSCILPLASWIAFRQMSNGLVWPYIRKLVPDPQALAFYVMFWSCDHYKRK